jgi:Xaa-Pro dipeptidase
VTSVGVAALEEGGRIDFGRLRANRRARGWAAMDAAGIDVLVLGRPANIHWVSGARQLWTAGTRGWGPGCVAVRATGAVHLLSVWDEGVPAHIGRDRLYGLSWNPTTLLSRVAAIPGVGDAATVATDALSPLWARLLPAAAPSAALVDGEAVMRSARRIKSDDEISCVRTACAIAEAALDAAVGWLQPGVDARAGIGVMEQRMADLGVTAPAHERSCWPAGPAGDLMVLNPGVLYAGYEGGLGRTWPVGDATAAASRAEFGRWRTAFEGLVAACRPGVSGDELCRAWTSSGLDLPLAPLAQGVGMGMEPPLIGAGVGASEVLEPGMVLSVQASAGVVFGQQTVLVTDGAPEVLSHYGWGPLAES